MALFFDSDWSDARLAAVGLARADVADALGLGPNEIDELWKDQRELSVQDVRVLAGLLGVPGSQVAQRAGVSTPVPREEGTEPDRRLERIEAALVEIKSLLLALKAKLP